MNTATARRALFAACKRLGLDDAERHALIHGVTKRTSSSTDLTPAEWRAVLDHLNRATGHTSQDGKPASWRVGCEALGGKVGALLADQKLPWRYLTHGANGKPSMVKRLAGVDRLEFADSIGLRAIIAALAKRAAKADVAPAPSPATGKADVAPAPSPASGKADVAPAPSPASGRRGAGATEA